MRRAEDTVGYCLECDRIVRRAPDAGCVAGHPKEIVYGAMDVAPDEPVPELPKFNWGAFFMPPIWGGAHGAVIAGLIVLPLWLFLDSNIQSAVFGVDADTPLAMRLGVYAMTLLILIVTVALMAWFGKTGWGLAWRKEYADGTSQMTTDEFIRREKRWTWISIPFFFALLALAIYYWINFL